MLVTEFTIMLVKEEKFARNMMIKTIPLKHVDSGCQ